MRYSWQVYRSSQGVTMSSGTLGPLDQSDGRQLAVSGEIESNVACEPCMDVPIVGDDLHDSESRRSSP